MSVCLYHVASPLRVPLALYLELLLNAAEHTIAGFRKPDMLSIQCICYKLVIASRRLDYSLAHWYLAFHCMQIAEDPLSQLAAANWAATPGDGAKLPAFKPALVVDIYRKHLGGGGDKPPSLKRVMLLELSQYMELYLWPNFDPAKASYEHVMSVLLLINEKFRENVPAWGIFAADKVLTQTYRQKSHSC